MQKHPFIAFPFFTIWHLVCVVCILPMLTLDLSARTQAEAQKAAAEQALMERRAELMPRLSGQEQLRIAQYESRIEEGHSLLRSSEALMQTRPTALNPDRDIAADRRRGQAMRERGEAIIREARQGILDILRDLKQRLDSGTYVSPNAMRYDLAIPLVQIEDALPEAIAGVIERTRLADCQRIFFDTVFVWEGDSFVRDQTLGRKLYDLLLEEDGDRLVLGRAFDPVLQREEGASVGARPQLQFDNRSPIRSAIIAAEVFRLADDEAYLSFRTIDLDSWQMVAATLVKLKGTAETRARLFDAEGTVSRFDRLPEPYEFAMLSTFDSDSDTANFLHMRTIKTILAHRTTLTFGESVFMRTYYLPDGNDALEWEDAETAFFIVQQPEQTIEILARPSESEQALLIGTLEFPFGR